MSRKYLLGVIALIAVLALALQAYAQPQFPAHRAWNILNYPDGQPFANQHVIIKYYNVTDNTLLAHVDGTTDSIGNITLTLDVRGRSRSRTPARSTMCPSTGFSNPITA
jgi:hypothetical protein